MDNIDVEFELEFNPFNPLDNGGEYNPFDNSDVEFNPFNPLDNGRFPPPPPGIGERGFNKLPVNNGKFPSPSNGEAAKLLRNNVFYPSPDNGEEEYGQLPLTRLVPNIGDLYNPLDNSEVEFNPLDNVGNNRPPVNEGVYPLNTQASFKCNSGYKLEGSSSSTCQDQGSWNNEIPTCIQGNYRNEPVHKLEIKEVVI